MTLNYLNNKNYYILATLFCLCYALGPEKAEVTCYKAINQIANNGNSLKDVVFNTSLFDKKWSGEAVAMLTIGTVIATMIMMAIFNVKFNRESDERIQLMREKDMQEEFTELKTQAEAEKRIASHGLIQCCFEYVNTLNTSQPPGDTVKCLTYIKQGEALIKQCLNHGRIAAEWDSTSNGKACRVWLSSCHSRCIKDVYKATCSYKMVLICTDYCRTEYTNKMINKDCISIIAQYTIGALNTIPYNTSYAIQCHVGTISDNFADHSKSKKDLTLRYPGYIFTRDIHSNRNETTFVDKHRIYGQQFTDIVRGWW